jgi:hypothetical protein
VVSNFFFRIIVFFVIQFTDDIGVLKLFSVYLNKEKNIECVTYKVN